MSARRLPPGQSRPCVHGGKHPHGSKQRYTMDRCHCGPCRAANRDYQAQLRRAHAYGQADLVPADRAREHVQRLRAAGMGVNRIAAVSGVPLSVLSRLLWADHRNGRVAKRMRRSTEAKLLALDVDLATSALVPGVGSRRRLQAMVALGWTQKRLAQLLGVEPENLRVTMRSERVFRSTSERVAELYERIGDEPPPVRNHWEAGAVTASRRRAAEAGWLPPAAWDDPDTDPEPVIPIVRADKRPRYDGVNVVEDVEWLIRCGATREHIAYRLGESWPTLERLLQRHGRQDLITRSRGLEAAS